jgi:hypothetical protein
MVASGLGATKVILSDSVRYGPIDQNLADTYIRDNDISFHQYSWYVECFSLSFITSFLIKSYQG